MTYQLSTFYCSKCRAATPHEFDEENWRARCTVCADKQIPHAAQRRAKLANEIERHMQALDGPDEKMGKRK